MVQTPPLDAAAIDARGHRMVSGLAAAVSREGADRIGTLLLDHLTPPFGDDAVVFVGDLQQSTLVACPRPGPPAPQLDIDGTVAGRCFRLSMPQRGGRLHPDDPQHDASVTTWWPLLDGGERMGVLGVERASDDADHPQVSGWLAELADAVATTLLMSQRSSDTVTCLRRTREMDVAAEMQWALLPPLAFEDARVRISGALEPAYQVAGDTFDYAVDSSMARFAVLDAVGHGLSSSLLASLAVSSYRNARRRGRTLPESVGDIEADLGLTTEGFVTGFLGELDTVTGLLRWVSAGHEAPVLLRGSRAVKELVADARHPLGMRLGSQEWGVSTEQLEPGDRLLVFTDGVPDARSPDGEFFGVDRLVDHVRRHLASGLSAAEIMRRIVHSLLSHQQGRLQDDATFLMVEWKDTARAPEPV